MFVIEGSYSFNNVTLFIEYPHREVARFSLGDVLIVRLQGFHLVMLYMGSIGSVSHVMTGHAYSRALVAYLSTTASLMSDLPSSKDALKGVDTSHLKRLLESARVCSGLSGPHCGGS